jgi:hypothetical protein
MKVLRSIDGPSIDKLGLSPFILLRHGRLRRKTGPCWPNITTNPPYGLPGVGVGGLNG